MSELLLEYLPPELVFKIEKQLHKLYMNDLIEEINLEYFRRYEYEEMDELDMCGNYMGWVINNYDERPNVDERHGRTERKRSW